MTDWYDDVLAFQKKFDQPILDAVAWPPPKVVDLRMALILEEFEELAGAISSRNILETADALADLVYVCVGTAQALGIDLREVWREVQRSNMAKGGGAVRPDGKLLKPEGWKPPDIARALRVGKPSQPSEEPADFFEP